MCWALPLCAGGAEERGWRTALPGNADFVRINACGLYCPKKQLFAGNHESRRGLWCGARCLSCLAQRVKKNWFCRSAWGRAWKLGRADFQKARADFLPAAQPQIFRVTFAVTFISRFLPSEFSDARSIWHISWRYIMLYLVYFWRFAYLLVFFLTFLLAVHRVSWRGGTTSHHMAYLLAFYLVYLLTYLLAFYRPICPRSIWRMALFLAYLLAFYLPYLMASMSFPLACLLALFQTIFLVRRCPLTPTIWNTVPIDVEFSVEVRRCPLRLRVELIGSPLWMCRLCLSASFHPFLPQLQAPSQPGAPVLFNAPRARQVCFSWCASASDSEKRQWQHRIRVADLECVARLGCGMFGVVSLVCHRFHPGHSYAR